MTELKEMIIKHKFPVIAFVVLAIVMGIFAGVFNSKIEPETLNLEQAISDKQAINIKAETVDVFETVPGTLRAREATVISSRILAGIKAIHVRPGDFVEAGQLLVELDNQDLLARQEQWQQQVKSFEVRLQQVKPHFERVKKLYDEGISSRAELDRATADYQGVLAQLAGAQASAQEAKTSVSFSQIKAPISGRIIDRLAEPGSVANPGMGLLSIYNPLTLRVEVNVRETLAISLNVGDEIEGEVPSLDKKFTTIIEEIVPEAHTGSRSFLLKAAIPSDTTLMPGLFVRLQIPIGEEQHILIPQSYVLEMGQLNMVWVVTDGVAHKQIVTLGEVDANGKMLLIKGLNEGDVIIQPEAVD